MFSQIPRTALILLAFIASVTAHFTLDYPTTRGFDEDIEGQFCGGFPTVSSVRNVIPVSGNVPIQINSAHASAAVALLISPNPNPADFNDFNSELAKSWFQAPPGSSCFNVDFSQLGMSLGNGSVVTIQVQYAGGDGNLFQCSDLVVIEGSSIPSNVTCANDVSLATNATVTVTPAAGSTATSSPASMSGSMGSSSSITGGTTAAASASATGAAVRLTRPFFVGGFVAAAWGWVM